MWVLLGIAVIVVGFLLRFNPLLVVAISALVTGLAAGIDPIEVLAAFGKAFNDARYVSVVYIVLPVIGILERHGLQERARRDRCVPGRHGGAVADRLPRVPSGDRGARADLDRGARADRPPAGRADGAGRG